MAIIAFEIDFHRSEESNTNYKARCGFYCASYEYNALRGIRHGAASVCLCVCLSQVGVIQKWLNIAIREQRRMIAQGL